MSTKVVCRAPRSSTPSTPLWSALIPCRGLQHVLSSGFESRVEGPGVEEGGEAEEGKEPGCLKDIHCGTSKVIKAVESWDLEGVVGRTEDRHSTVKSRGSCSLTLSQKGDQG